MVSKIWVGMPSFTPIQNSRSFAKKKQNKTKNADFKCWYIITHTEEKSTISNITFVILLF